MTLLWHGAPNAASHASIPLLQHPEDPVPGRKTCMNAVSVLWIPKDGGIIRIKKLPSGGRRFATCSVAQVTNQSRAGRATRVVLLPAAMAGFVRGLRWRRAALRHYRSRYTVHAHVARSRVIRLLRADGRGRSVGHLQCFRSSKETAFRVQGGTTKKYTSFYAHGKVLSNRELKFTALGLSL